MKIHPPSITYWHMPFDHYNKNLKPVARRLRNEGTKAEKRMWYELLSGKRFLGYRFLRQRIIENYIVDFYCPELKLIVEVDGKSHDFRDVQERGGGIYNRNMLDLDSTHIVPNTSSSNSASAGSLNLPNASGGGIYNEQNASKLYCRNSTIKGNIILSLNGRGQGAGIRTEFGTGTLINSVISGNFNKD